MSIKFSKNKVSIIVFILFFVYVNLLIISNNRYECAGSSLPSTYDELNYSTKILDNNKYDAGIVSYGPYVSAKKGMVLIRINYNSQSNMNYFDLYSGKLGSILYEDYLYSDKLSTSKNIKLTNTVDDLEIRVHYAGEGNFELQSILIFNLSNYIITSIWANAILLLCGFLLIKYKDKVYAFIIGLSDIQTVIICAVIISASILVFLQTSISISPDGFKYISYIDYFEGNKALNTWDNVRGFTYPALLFIGEKIFGNTMQGLILTNAMLYIIICSFVYCIINMLTNKNKKNYGKVLSCFISFILIGFNANVFTWQHYVLTESYVLVFALFWLFYLIKDFNRDSKTKDRYGFIIKVLCLSLLTIIMWFLKQMFASIPILLFMSFTMINDKKDKFKKRLVQTAIGTVVALMFFGCSIIIFNKAIDLENQENYYAKK